MSDKQDYDRRKFIGALAMSSAGLLLPEFSGANQKSLSKMHTQLQSDVSIATFKNLKQVNAGVLNIGYAEEGPIGRPVVLLLHGWPYDIYSFAEAVPILVTAGYRVIIPYLRGYGTTSFLSDKTVRNGQQSVFAMDAIALMDALSIPKAIIAGCDWGARTACIMAALWPERCKALVSVSGYLIGSQAAGKMPLPPKAELQWWYQYYFVTERGRDGYDKNRDEFAKLIWQLASPKWNFPEATFDRTKASLQNPDHVSIVVHNYRWRLGLAEGESKYDDLEKRLLKLQSLLYQRLHLKEMQMAHRTLTQVSIQRNFQVNMLTGY